MLAAIKIVLKKFLFLNQKHKPKIMKKFITLCFLSALLQFSAHSQSITHSDLLVTVLNTADSLTDKTLIGFNTSSTDSFDSKYDTIKLAVAPGHPSLYTINSEQLLSTNIMQSVTSVAIVHMGFKPGETGNFVMSFKDVKSFDPTTYIILQDIKTGTLHNVLSGNYNFTADSAENPNRFILHFSPPVVINTTPACDNQGLVNVRQPGAAIWNYVLSNSGNNVNLTGVLNLNNPINATVPAGNYILTLTDSNNYVASKVITVTGVPVLTAGFNASSNNVTVQTPITFTNTSKNADTYSWDFGDGTSSSSLANPTHTYTTEGTYNVNLTVMNGTGCLASIWEPIIVNSTTTGIIEAGQGNNNINVWSYGSGIYVNFAHTEAVNAEIKISDVLGREISIEKFAGGNLYQKQLNAIDASYVIVSVTNNNKTTTAKLFISNGK